MFEGYLSFWWKTMRKLQLIAYKSSNIFIVYVGMLML